MSALSETPKQSLEYLSNAASPQSSTRPDKGKSAYRWNRENYSRNRRRFDIWVFVLRLLFEFWRDSKPWSYPGGYTEEKRQKRRKAQAAWIRESLLELGPTFIKVGQLFSTRGDLFPIEYVEELSKLQDRVPAFSYEQVAAIVKEDTGKSITELFRAFDPTPLAAASLGQVHKAQLNSGEEVVAKVQRPGLKKLFTIDLAILKRIAQYFQNHPRWGKGRDWLGIYDECCRILWEETDYLNEGRNADTFRRNFREYDWVRVPRVYWRYTSPRVLTLEYVPGIKISHYEALEAAGLDRKLLAKLGAEAYLQQLLNDGFFHADPHPGNIAVSPDGKMIFYDFGMMGKIQANVREKLMDTLFGIAEKNADRVMQSLIELGALAPTGDVGPTRRSIQYMLDNFMDKPFEEQSVTAISDDLYELAYDQPFRFPATFTFVMRAFSTLEGVGKGLDPEFNFMEVAKPFAMDVMTNSSASNGNSIFNELGRQAAQVSSTALGLPRRIEDTIEKLERGDIRVRVRSIESDRILRRISTIQLLTNYTLLVAAFTLSATILLVNDKVWWAAIAALAAGGLGFTLFRLMRRLDRFDRMP
ncbi:AarF/ABC1/UbiB kinase family protein [Lusitaniella coriacea LEGE 07157]|uniref:AarF/ABC1/UbiB kinase family protein n=1 Tax=Lusitaniella coriacea LEGE 07157 TaxID=945747 RepID=A0A8J7DL64_9CYAN|nr:AarF/ABC1/UbiB kinase family protein [Lusitaniella coriacea]MBE9114293.1 AarF/ABC1/UbiB kinase family protein [Lusitaniella coriacea LEGE 07157]